MLKKSDTSQLKLARKSVTEFKGVVGGLSKDPKKLMHARNIYCDGLGVHSAPPRRKVRNIVNCGGIGSDGNLFWVEDRRIYYNGYQLDEIYLSAGEKKLLTLGGYLLVLPDALYVSLSDTSKYGFLQASLGVSGNAEIKNCRSDLSVIESFSVLEAEPENAAAGDFRLVRENGECKMLRYDGYEWLEAETYIRVLIPGVGNVFHAGDAVKVVGVDENCDKWLKIRQISNDYVYFGGCVSNVEPRSVTLGRYFPELDFATVSNGRLCGVSVGYDGSGKLVDRLYESAVGNPFDVCPSGEGEGFVFELPLEGGVRAVADHDGSLAIFTDKGVTEVSVGSKLGCASISGECISKGAEKSIAELGGALYFKGEHGICVYNGGSVKVISSELGVLKNSANGGAGTSYKGKYYQCSEMGGEGVILQYDPLTRFWGVSDDPGVLAFTVRNGILYAVTKPENAGGELIILDIDGLSAAELEYCSDGENYVSEQLPWELESGMLCFEDMNGIYPEFITVRMAKNNGNTKVSALTDLETEGAENVLLPSHAGVYTVPLRSGKCDTARLRLEGDGVFLLLAFMLSYTSEGEMRQWK